jgi:hypothetical protein
MDTMTTTGVPTISASRSRGGCGRARSRISSPAEASGAPAEAYVLRDLLFARGGQVTVEAQNQHVEVAEPVPGLAQFASAASGIAQAPLFTAATAVSSIGYLTSFVLGDELVAFPTYLRRAMQFALHSTDPSLIRSGAGIAEVMEPAQLNAMRVPAPRPRT